MSQINKLLLFTTEIPFIGEVDTLLITITLIVFFVIVVLFSLIITKLNKRRLRILQLAAKPYSTILDSDEECVSKCYERLYRGDIESAIFFLDKAIKIKPEKEERYLVRGNLKYKSGDYEGAMIDFSKTIYLDPKNASAYYQRGLAKKNMGLQADAKNDFDTAIELGFINNNSSENSSY